MKRLGIVVLTGMIAGMLALSLPAMATDSQTLEVQVNDNYQLIDNSGQVYEVVDSATGNELVEVHVGKKAKVNGIVERYNDVAVIEVISYQLLDE